MNNKILEINKANKNNKKFKKNNSITDKKLTVLDSDISRLYKKYSIAKKERLNQEKEQKTIINRIKYIEDEEKKMQLKCKQQMEKINSLTKKLAKRKSQQKPNNNFKLNKLFVKNEAKIKTISDNSSLNGNIYLKINFKNDNKEAENTLPHNFLTEKSNLPKEKNINKNNIIYKRKEKK